MERPAKGSLRADLALVGLMAVWGTTFPIVRVAFRGDHPAASPLAFVAARMALAVAMLAAWLALRERASLAAMFTRAALRPGGIVRDGAIVGALLAVGFLLQNEGAARTTASRSAFLTGLLVPLVPLFEAALFKRPPRRSSVFAVGLAFAGVALLTSPWDAGAGATAAGDALTVACAVVFALHINALGRFAPRHGAKALVLVQLTCVALAASVVGPLVETPHLEPRPALGLALAYMAVFATVLAFSVQAWSQQRTTPVRLALISALEPLFAALFSAFALGERLGPAGYVGGALIVGGIVVGELGAVGV